MATLKAVFSVAISEKPLSSEATVYTQVGNNPIYKRLEFGRVRYGRQS